MADRARQFKSTDSPSVVGDPRNYLDRRNKGGVPTLDLSGNRLAQDITDMFQVAVASAMTTAALQSARAR